MTHQALGRGTAQIITAQVGPALPLLHYPIGADFPTYTGPLGVARLYVRRDRHLIELSKYGSHSVFLATDPDGEHVEEYACRYPTQESALRAALGIYFHHHHHTSASLAADLRRVIEAELNQLTEAS